MQCNQTMPSIADQGFIAKYVLNQMGEGDYQVRSQMVYCESADQAVATLSANKADLVLVLSEDKSPINNVIEYIYGFNFEGKSLPIVLYFKE